jgi:Mrp family chromosome partitioning ATPase
MNYPEQPVTIQEEKKEQEERRLRQRMGHIRRKLVVLSGKGGVGKSTVAANLALALAKHGHKVGLLDVDVHGPSIPKLLGLEGVALTTDGTCILPVALGEKCAIMSIGFLLGRNADAVIWRGPLKFHIIRQFLSDVCWGDLDYLVIDCPPGTGDEPLSVAQLVGSGAAALVVTTPQELAIADVRRCVTFCGKTGLPVVGVLENMSGYVCPQCGARSDLFGTGGGEKLAQEMGLVFLGCIPIDPRIVACGDRGTSLLQMHPESPAAQSFVSLAERLEQQDDLWRRALEEPVSVEGENR